MFKKLQESCASLERQFDQIPDERKLELEEIGQYINDKINKGEQAELIVICTHNSRRSHMGQLWLHAAAAHYGLESISTYSGGTEATAFNPRAVSALQNMGFDIEKMDDSSNPKYMAKISQDDKGIELFSKRFGADVNPQKNFAAILVCSDADEACPIVLGADGRFPIPYKDPKHADNTASEADAYRNTCMMIGREMLYAVQFAKSGRKNLSIQD